MGPEKNIWNTRQLSSSQPPLTYKNSTSLSEKTIPTPPPGPFCPIFTPSCSIPFYHNDFSLPLFSGLPVTNYPEDKPKPPFCPASQSFPGPAHPCSFMWHGMWEPHLSAHPHIKTIEIKESNVAELAISVLIPPALQGAAGQGSLASQPPLDLPALQSLKFLQFMHRTCQVY